MNTRHARQTCGENLCGHARIATGGLQRRATHPNAAPGRTYSQIARRNWLENLTATARDHSPAMASLQTRQCTPGSTYSNSLALSDTQTGDDAPARGAADE